MAHSLIPSRKVNTLIITRRYHSVGDLASSSQWQHCRGARGTLWGHYLEGRFDRPALERRFVINGGQSGDVEVQSDDGGGLKQRGQSRRGGNMEPHVEGFRESLFSGIFLVSGVEFNNGELVVAPVNCPNPLSIWLTSRSIL